MAILPLEYAPNDIFKKIAQRVEAVDDEIRKLVDDMFETMYYHKAVGIGANMVGVLKRIAIVDLQEDGNSIQHTFINPEIIWHSKELQSFKEGSICFPGISAEITRSKSIKVSYIDYHGDQQTLQAEGWFATVIQHELDYLNGKVFLDYLSKMKRDILIQKMKKYTR